MNHHSAFNFPGAQMDRFAHLEWPFFDAAHRRLARGAEAWARASLGDWIHGADSDAACRRLVREMGQAGWLRYAVPPGYGAEQPGAGRELDLHSICILREVFAHHGGLPDFALVMQGLGSGAISLSGSDALKARYLPRVSEGSAIAAFALSEPDAGSDVAAISATARREGGDYIVDGVKTWISNGGIADFHVVIARTGEAAGTRGLSALVVDADTPGLPAAERIDIIAPHPMATPRSGFRGGPWTRRFSARARAGCSAKRFRTSR